MAILQARISSSRLPNKVLAPILGEPMLSRQIERIRGAKTLNEIVVATSDGADDNPVAQLCARLGVACHRGSLDDVLGRFVGAYHSFGPSEHVVRLTGDCPLADPLVIDGVVTAHLSAGADYTTNALEPTWPDGLDVEIMRVSTLLKAAAEAKMPSEREHVTPYIHKHPTRFQINHIRHSSDLSSLRWTVDEPSDLEFVRKVYAELYIKKPDFNTDDILALMERKPELKTINNRFLRNQGYARSLLRDRQLIVK